VTQSTIRPSYSTSASAFERCAPAETLDLGGPPDSQAITTEISFGSFRLLPAQRLLLDGDKPVQLGSRALDVLTALVERPNELVSKEELTTRVWPRTFVHPANLAVHMSALRRALRDGRDGNRFFINVPGRGYVFVAPITICGPTKPCHPASPKEPLHNPPAPAARLIAEEANSDLAPWVLHNRLVTVAGSDGKKQLKHKQPDRRRRPLRAGLVHRPTTKAFKHSLVTISQ
jgi:DNA-binding winged helix-turn-helix (wHTH) protein